jgi:hypothetical protein
VKANTAEEATVICTLRAAACATRPPAASWRVFCERTTRARPNLSRVLVSAYASLGFTLNGFSESLEVHEVRLYNAATGRFLRALPLRKARANPLVEFSSDSRTLVVRYFAPTYVNYGYGPVNNDWSVELWDVPAGLADE